MFKALFKLCKVVVGFYLFLLFCMLMMILMTNLMLIGLN